MTASPSPARGWRGRAVVAVAVVLWLLGAPAAGARQAGNSAPPDDPPQQRAVLDLVVNHAKAGQVLAVIRRSDILVSPDALRRAGMREVGGRTEIVGTRSFVSLASLAPDVRYRLDEKELVLQLTTRPEQLGTHRVDLRAKQRPAYTFTRPASAFLNYGLDWRQGGARNATTELGINVRGVLLSTGGTWQQGRRFVPGMTSLLIDDRERLRRIVVGESVAGDRLLGGNVLLAGVKVARDYGLDPYFVRYPLLGMSGLVETPSVVEVYVDGRLMRQERLQPGRFELANIPVPMGSSRTQILVRDVFGREQEVRTPYYLANNVLAAGLHEYEYGVGLPRVNASDYQVAYESPVILMRHRYGFSNMVTGGLRLEAREGLLNAGPSVNLRAPIGEFEVAGALSGGRAGTGGAVALGYTWNGSPLSVGISGRGATAAYRTISSVLRTSESRFEINAFSGMRLGRAGGVSIQHSQGETFARVRHARTSVFVSARVGARMHLFANVGRAASSGNVTAVATVGLSLAVGAQNLATVSTGLSDGASVTSVEVMRSLPWGTGYGYRLRGGTAGDPFASGRVAYQSPYGRYEFGQDARDGVRAASVSIAGGVVAIGGSLFATRPVRDGYGLIRVPGVQGVRGYLSNQQIGRTNRRGDLIIPNLLPYYANRLSIADQDIPIGREIPVREQAIAPPYRGGAVATFKADKVGAVTGVVGVLQDGQPVVPEYGDLILQKESGPDVSPIGRGGRFYFERVRPGRYTATVRYHGASCDFALLVRPSAAPVVNTGAHSCRLEAKAP